MTAHQKPDAFLTSLLLHLDQGDRPQLREDLAKAAREGRCIRRAMILMLVLLLLAAAGLGYCALLLPEIFRNPAHLLTRSLLVLGLGSLISQMVVLGHLFWHRITVTRLHEECRRLVLALAESQNNDPDTRGRAGRSPAGVTRLHRENHPSLREPQDPQLRARPD